MDIKQKISEAEAYQKHGLYTEALGLFEELLKNKSGLNAAIQNKLEKNILRYFAKKIFLEMPGFY